MALTIGDFARIGDVSPRMLRHYDRLGLLRPQQVDSASGYRYYSAAQLARLNRLIALKGLGFSLDEVAGLLGPDTPDGQSTVSPEAIRGMLALRQSQVAAEVQTQQRRLAEIASRLRTIEQEGEPSSLAFVEKPLRPVTLAQRRGQVEDMSQIGPLVASMFESLIADLADVGFALTEPSYAWYRSHENGTHLGIGFRASTLVPVRPDVEAAQLPGCPRALTVVHQGVISDIASSWYALAHEIEARGLQMTGAAREVYHSTPLDRPTQWVTEIQQPVADAAAPVR
jgi:DNA-binding transcriptional MerR regulator/effector-binding domain-containing protein